MDSLLELRAIRKRFQGVTAVDGVDFDLAAGEVHALMGENGAGKSTLLKIATGVHPADSGEIRLDGRPIAPSSPTAAVELGISTVYQEINLVPNLSVAENVCLGREPSGPFGIRWQALEEKARAALARIGLEIDVRRALGGCSIAVQQMVAIARALDVSARVLILDEPTSSLDAHEVGQLFRVIRRLRDEGLGIVFVTHFLDQVFDIADRVTVLRNGKRVGCWQTGELSRRDLVSHMIGRRSEELERRDVAAPASEPGAPVLECRSLARKGSISDVSLTVRGGEVLGLAGLLGSGRTETLRLLFGLDAAETGTLLIDGGEAARHSPRNAIRKGIGYCSEDRKAEGLFADLTVRENILLALQVRRGWLRPLPRRFQDSLTGELVGRLNIQPADTERPIRFLSGGNQQKALLARWLAIDPRALLLDEPTRGIDVGAKFEIMSLIDKLRREGKAFVFVSSELPEVVRTCGVVLVLRDRAPCGRLEGDQITERSIVDLIAGGAP